MWAIIKIDQKKFKFLLTDLKKKLGPDFQIYNPKLQIQTYKSNKLVEKEFNLLGDYLLCFHKKFNDKKIINTLHYCKGLKYILNGFFQSQPEIKNFIERCKKSETGNGYLSQDFFKININSKFQFISGPFTNTIFKIIGLQKNKIRILMGNLKTTIRKKEFLFKPA